MNQVWFDCFYDSEEFEEDTRILLKALPQGIVYLRLSIEDFLVNDLVRGKHKMQLHSLHVIQISQKLQEPSLLATKSQIVNEE